MKKVKYKFVFNRKNRLNKEGKSLIQLRLTKYSTQKYIGTGVYITPNCWDEASCCVKRQPNKIEVNKFLHDFKEKIEKYEYKQLSNGKELDLNRLDDVLHDMPQGDFIAFFEREAENSTRTYNTIRNYRSCLSYLKKFGIIKSFSDLNYKNIVEFDAFLKRSKISNTTVHKQHKVLKFFIRKATDMDILKYEQNPYLKFRPDPPDQTMRRYLTPEELKSIEEKDLHIDRLAKVRDLFLFSCYTGIGYVDLEKLSKNNIVLEDGMEWIVIARTKTGSPSYIPLFPQAKKLLEKYDYKIPIITNQKVNAFLKEIQVLCDINQNLNFHMARHTFATTITLSHGVPIESVSEMLGHSNIKITQIYAKILKSKIRNNPLFGLG
jgi:integrase/recombinase XerD